MTAKGSTVRRQGRTILVVLAAAVVSVAGSPDPKWILDQMRKAQRGVTTLHAHVTQTKTYPQLGIDDPVERGDFYMARSANDATRVRLEIREPEIRILTVAKGDYVLYQPRIRQAMIGKLDGGGSKALFAGILTGSASVQAALERDYLVSVEGETVVSDTPVVELRFTAAPSAVVYCRRIDLWLDTRSYLPVQQSCHEANDSIITFTLTEVSLGGPLDDELFEQKLPAGVEKVRG